MVKEYFPQVKGTIPFEGPDSDSPLAFRYYDADRVIGDRSMADHLRFSVAYWHTFKGTGTDMFGAATYNRPWNSDCDPLNASEDAMRACFEFCTKLGVSYYCFHDRDIAPEGRTFAESKRNLHHIVDLAEKLQADNPVKCLWGTANLFSNPRYAHGAATNPDAHVFAYAAAQVKNAIDATLRLKGENYVFWGGREGYESLLNTDIAREQQQLARFLHMAVDYAGHTGFKGQFLIEPKPKEPTKHQYDFDAATVLSFLKSNGLWNSFKLNIEANHATLAGHTFEHELAVASAFGKLGSVDANRGDLLLGWDTDQLPTDVYSTTYAMLIILSQGGLGSGGLNFDAKCRRGSIDTIDLFHAHIGAMDTFARGLLTAQRIIDDGILSGRIADRYASYDSGIGAKILSGNADLQSLEKWIIDNGEPKPISGGQEALENLVNRYI